MKLLLPLILLLNLTIHAQDPIFIDAKGVMRWTATKKEAAFFGVNYTTPFAYSYRTHKKLGIDLKKAIDADAYHLARLGIDAFRVHVWDVEISDSAGNLLQNEHLDLFDYLLSKLEERRIHILITPIAFWGNGYPDPDEQTPGFSTKYGKRNAVVNENAIRAQENYLQQFFRHVNPYTKKTYAQDPWVVAMEINNEPQHSGPKAKVTEYVNRLAAAVRGTGWTKPVFYNISESPAYADAVVAAKVDGHSFQWYPTGLVAGFEQKGNLLPHVDEYRIPFLDTIPAFRNRARMVYEFDAGDVLQPFMYPAMARSFRTAGFQWATQFAYDPLYLAPYNTEYQTHYLNLVYTPAKAISLLIASRAFHQLPRGKSWGRFPKNIVFDEFQIDYRQLQSRMNSEEEYYHTGNTSLKPRNTKALKHIAGVGSSPLVNASLSGAYFLDKIGPSAWRLEVFPEIRYSNEAFIKHELDSAFAFASSSSREFEFRLPGLKSHFQILNLQDSTVFDEKVSDGRVRLSPGSYLLYAGRKPTLPDFVPGLPIRVNEFVPPPYQERRNSWKDDAASIIDTVLFSLANKGKTNFYVPDWKKTSVDWTNTGLQFSSTDTLFGFQLFIGEQIAMRHRWSSQDWKLSLQITASEDSIPANIALVSNSGEGYSAPILLKKGTNTYMLDIIKLKPSKYLLLPRPYPAFQPLYFESSVRGYSSISAAEQLQLRVSRTITVPISFTIESIQLKK